jgi:ribosomal protein S18 acetylase RimI-like enzyme
MPLGPSMLKAEKLVAKRITAAVATDAIAVAGIGRVAFVRQYEGLVDPANYTWAARQWHSDAAVLESITKCETDAAACFLVAERDGRIVGFLQYDEAGPEPELHRIYVAPNAQGSGVGGALMNVLHEHLASTATYVLVVVESNDAAVRFYQRHSLREEQRVDAHSYYRHTAGIVFPAQARDFRCVLMRYRQDQ